MRRGGGRDAGNTGRGARLGSNATCWNPMVLSDLYEAALNRPTPMMDTEPAVGITPSSESPLAKQYANSALVRSSPSPMSLHLSGLFARAAAIIVIRKSTPPR
jgi:hypothetical protein